MLFENVAKYQTNSINLQTNYVFSYTKIFINAFNKIVILYEVSSPQIHTGVLTE